MDIFPTKQHEFKLIDGQAETLNRLNRRTEKSKNLTSNHTGKSFRGLINGNEFKLISSAVGKGAFCVMTGTIEFDKGHVKVEIHKVFKVLLGILLLLPIFGLVAIAVSNTEDFSSILVLVALLQLLIIRYVFIEFAFKLLSKESLKRLRDVLDIKWM